MSPDPWEALRRATRARIGLGRIGDAMPLRPVLDFQLAHARARDAVHAALDTVALAAAVAPHPAVMVRSAAPDRTTYLKRPDLGRRLDHAAAGDLQPVEADVVFVMADGLSARAVQQQAPALFRACVARLSGWQLAPVVIAQQGRVALGDAIGERLGVPLCVMLIGERPGLSVAESLGIYLTFDPRTGRRDSERNCISNVHAAGGLSCEAAADRLVWLMTQAQRRRITGIGLKDDSSQLFAPMERPAIT